MMSLLLSTAALGPGKPTWHSLSTQCWLHRGCWKPRGKEIAFLWSVCYGYYFFTSLSFSREWRPVDLVFVLWNRMAWTHVLYKWEEVFSCVMDYSLQKAPTIKQNRDWILKYVGHISRKVDTSNCSQGL